MHIYIYISIQICVYQQQIPVGVCLPSAFFQFASWWFCFRLSMTRSRLPSIQSAQLNAARIPTTLLVCVHVCVCMGYALACFFCSQLSAFQFFQICFFSFLFGSANVTQITKAHSVGFIRCQPKSLQGYERFGGPHPIGK